MKFKSSMFLHTNEGIYMIFDFDENLRYIGLSMDIKTRLKQHKQITNHGDGIYAIYRHGMKVYKFLFKFWGNHTIKNNCVLKDYYSLIEECLIKYLKPYLNKVFIDYDLGDEYNKDPNDINNITISLNIGDKRAEINVANKNNYPIAGGYIGFDNNKKLHKY